MAVQSANFGLWSHRGIDDLGTILENWENYTILRYAIMIFCMFIEEFRKITSNVYNVN